MSGMLPLSVEDNDKSRASRELVQAFVQSTYFDLKPERPPGETPSTCSNANGPRPSW
jgi:hypothetical protein